MNVSRGNSLWQRSSTAAFISRFFLVMARKLTVSEALESVLQLETSSDDGSEVEEDPFFLYQRATQTAKVTPTPITVALAQ